MSGELESIRCDGCGNWIAALVDGEVVIRHRGREIGGAQWVKCEHCGQVWRARLASELVATAR